MRDRSKQLAAKKRYREANRERINAENKAYRKANPEKIKSYLEANQERLTKNKVAWAKRNPEKRAAHVVLGNAIRRNKLVKAKACQRCGAEGRVEAHHADYAKPLEVEWLCLRCHVEEHST